MYILSDYRKFQLFNCFKIMKICKSKARNEKNDLVVWEVRLCLIVASCITIMLEGKDRTRTN